MAIFYKKLATTTISEHNIPFSGIEILCSESYYIAITPKLVLGFSKLAIKLKKYRVCTWFNYSYFFAKETAIFSYPNVVQSRMILLADHTLSRF